MSYEITAQESEVLSSFYRAFIELNILKNNINIYPPLLKEIPGVFWKGMYYLCDHHHQSIVKTSSQKHFSVCTKCG